MAPRETLIPKASSKAGAVKAIKTTKKNKVNMNKTEVSNQKSKPKTEPVPKVVTPKSTKKENKQANVTGSVTKSAKKAMWNRRPKPAHSGVPVPEKMKRCLAQLLTTE